MRTLTLLLLVPMLSSASLSLHELQARALEDSPRLAAARARLEATRLEAEAAGTLPDPKLSWGHYFSSVETRLGPQEEKLTLSQTFPMGGKLGLAAEAAQLAAESEAEALRGALLDLRFEVERAYLRQAYLAKAMGIETDDLRILNALEKVVESKVRTGARSRADLLRLQMEIHRGEDRLAALDDARIAELAHIAALAGETPGSLETLETHLPERELPPALSSLGNPMLARKDREISRRQKLATRASRNGIPDITFGLSTVITGELEGSPAEDNGRDPWMLSLSLNLPIWRGKLRADRQAAEAEHRLARMNRRDAELLLEAELRKLNADWREAHRRLRLQREDLLPRAEEILKLTESDYRHGRASFDELLRVRRDLLDLRLSEMAALRDREITRAGILRLAGIHEGEKP